jgi:hypothetical protein
LTQMGLVRHGRIHSFEQFALGQKPKWRGQIVMSALPLKADIRRMSWHAGLMPVAELLALPKLH